MTAAAVIFRSEIAILLGAESLLLLFHGKVSLLRDTIYAGILGSGISLILTVVVDSYFWRKFPLWPEWAAFYFNVVEGKSSDWGTSPWYFYFINALPRLLLNPLSWLLCIPTALKVESTRKGALDASLPSLFFIALYSILPHKEWRFIVYTIPVLTAVAAVGAAWIWTRRSKKTSYYIFSIALALSVIASFGASLLMLYVSAANYPGGYALYELNSIASANDGSATVIKVHLDNLSYQTGAVQLVQNGLLSPQIHNQSSVTDSTATKLSKKPSRTEWIYNRDDNPASLADPSFWDQFDYAVAEYQKPVLENWEQVHTIHAFAGVGLVLDGGELLSSSTEEAKMIDPTVVRLQLPENWPLHHYAKSLEGKLQSLVTKGRWPALKFKPRLTILRRIRD